MFEIEVSTDGTSFVINSNFDTEATKENLIITAVPSISVYTKYRIIMYYDIFGTGGGPLVEITSQEGKLRYCTEFTPDAPVVTTPQSF